MGKQRHVKANTTQARRGLARILAASMLAGVLVTAAPVAGAPVAAAGGCIDKLEIETPAEKATAYGAVTLAAGETFRADIKHWTSAPNAATWRNGFNSEIRLSPMLDDGFPGYASTAQRDAFAADGPWDVDGFMNDGTFTYTNPSNSNVTSFVLEVGFWNHPADGIVGRTEASGFSTCVAPHSPPDRPTRDCPAAPTLVANGPNVWSEPFELKKNAYISMRMVDERPLRYNDAGEALPLLRNDYLIRTWLYGRSGPDDTWHYIRRDSHRSQNNWLRGSYVGSWDISIKNSSDYTEVMVIFGKWISRGYALSTPLDVSIKDPGQPWRSTCLISTQTTVTWDSAQSCAVDDTARIQAQVRNKSGATTGYRISLVDPATGDQVHGSHHHSIDNNATGTVALGGIPTGSWLVRMYERQPDGTEALVGSAIRQTFDRDDCVPADPCADGSALEEPTFVDANVVETTFAASWDEVQCAEEYRWRLSGPNFERNGVSAGSLSMNLDLSTDASFGRYCLSVSAVNNGGRVDSPWANSDGSIPEGCAVHEEGFPALSAKKQTDDSDDGGIEPAQNPDGPRECQRDSFRFNGDRPFGNLVFDPRWNRVKVRVDAHWEDSDSGVNFGKPKHGYGLYRLNGPPIDGVYNDIERLHDLGFIGEFSEFDDSRRWVDLDPLEPAFDIGVVAQIGNREGVLCGKMTINHQAVLEREGLEPGKAKCFDWHLRGADDAEICATFMTIAQTDFALTFDDDIISYTLDGDLPAELDDTGVSQGTRNAVICAGGNFVIGLVCSLIANEVDRSAASDYEDSKTLLLNRRKGNAELGGTTVCAAFFNSSDFILLLDSHGFAESTNVWEPYDFDTARAATPQRLIEYNPYCTADSGEPLHWEAENDYDNVRGWLDGEVCPDVLDFTARLVTNEIFSCV